jgi:hypothetical protein
MWWGVVHWGGCLEELHKLVVLFLDDTGPLGLTLCFRIGLLPHPFVL